MTDEKKEPRPVPIDWPAHIERDLEWMCRPACAPEERERYAQRIREMVARAARDLESLGTFVRLRNEGWAGPTPPRVITLGNLWPFPVPPQNDEAP